ncbi:MAG TPA: C39 family peptidase [Terriglobia bacterium]|nr:C39 family peptidase [Terriglobia bacterium]
MGRLTARHTAVALCLAFACAAAAIPGLWLNVPYVKQPKEGCGAACISMILEYWARQDPGFKRRVPDVEAIQHALYSPKAHGIFARDMERYLRQQGLRVFVFRGDWNTLRENLRKGRPLIVCLREGSVGSTLHYVVVTGLDSNRGVVLVNDPAGRKLEMIRRQKFEKSWRAEHDWTLLAVPRS